MVPYISLKGHNIKEQKNKHTNGSYIIFCGTEILQNQIQMYLQYYSSISMQC